MEIKSLKINEQNHIHKTLCSTGRPSLCSTVVILQVVKIHQNAINCAPYLFVSAFQLDRWLKWYDPNRRVTVISIQINLLFLDDYSQSEWERERRLVEVIFFVWAFACVLPFFVYFPSIFSSANICSQRLILSSICTFFIWNWFHLYGIFICSNRMWAFVIELTNESQQQQREK